MWWKWQVTDIALHMWTFKNEKYVARQKLILIKVKKQPTYSMIRFFEVHVHKWTNALFYKAPNYARIKMLRYFFLQDIQYKNNNEKKSSV